MQGQDSTFIKFGALILVGLMILAGGLYFGLKDMSVNGGNTGNSGGGNPVTHANSNFCPSDMDTSLTFDVVNGDNNTGAEEYDVTGYLYKKDGSTLEYVKQITDTTDPTAFTVDCGADYVLKFVGSDGASGDGSVITDIVSGKGTIVDGNLEFSADSASSAFVLKVNQHATLKAKAFDFNGNGWMYDNADASSSDYETDGVTWESVTNNATAYDEAQCIDVKYVLSAVQTDTDYQDRDILVLIEAPTSTWQEPTLKLDGVTLAKANLNDWEDTAYSDYEYAFVIPQSEHILDGAETRDLTFKMCLKSGVASASADPELDLAVRTQTLSQDNTNVIKSAVTDAASPAQVIAIWDSTIDVT